MKHSRIGIASVCLSAVPIVMITVYIAVVGLLGLLGEDSTVTRIADDIGGLVLFVGFVCAPIAGLILGIIGLCLKGRKRLFPILGTIANAVLVAAALCVVIFLMILAYQIQHQ
jgi:hypothetical protein